MHRKILGYGLLVVLLFATESNLVAAATKATTSVIIQDEATVEETVRDYFADAPVMIEIAHCESNFRQFADSGAVFKGGTGGGMVGVFQLYAAIHNQTALALGFDINTLAGNLDYARHLYQTSGVTPWQACVPDVSETDLDAQTQLKIELMTKLIVLLKQLLALKLANQ